MVGSARSGREDRARGQLPGNDSSESRQEIQKGGRAAPSTERGIDDQHIDTEGTRGQRPGARGRDQAMCVADGKRREGASTTARNADGEARRKAKLERRTRGAAQICRALIIAPPCAKERLRVFGFRCAITESEFGRT